MRFEEHRETARAQPVLMCRYCGKFRAQPDFEGRCAGCLYYGDGDPRGTALYRLRQKIREAAR
jgi:hypothetical protein